MNKRLALSCLLLATSAIAGVGIGDAANSSDYVKGISAPPPTIVQVWSTSRAYTACWDLRIAANKTLVIGQTGAALPINSQGNYFCGFGYLDDPAGLEMLSLLQNAKRDSRRVNIAMDETSKSDLGWKILAAFMF